MNDKDQQMSLFLFNNNNNITDNIINDKTEQLCP